MSRIGQLPIPIPEKVDVKIDGQIIRIKGPKGELTMELPKEFSGKKSEKVLEIVISSEKAKLGAKHGLFRALAWNMIVGVTEGFTKRLELHGVGYRAALQGKNLQLQLGYSHPVSYTPPYNVTLAVEGQNKVVVTGMDKHHVGQVAAEIRGLRPVEPYKGKGIRYQDEQFLRKAGKAAKGVGGGKA